MLYQLSYAGLRREVILRLPRRLLAATVFAAAQIRRSAPPPEAAPTSKPTRITPTRTVFAVTRVYISASVSRASRTGARSGEFLVHLTGAATVSLAIGSIVNRESRSVTIPA